MKRSTNSTVFGEKLIKAYNQDEATGFWLNALRLKVAARVQKGK